MDLDSSNTMPFWIASDRSFTGDEGYDEASPKEILQFSDISTSLVSSPYQYMRSERRVLDVAIHKNSLENCISNKYLRNEQAVHDYSSYLSSSPEADFNTSKFIPMSPIRNIVHPIRCDEQEKPSSSYRQSNTHQRSDVSYPSPHRIFLSLITVKEA
jgi:hypothetical protein